MSLKTATITTSASDQTRVALDQTACLAPQSDIGQTTIHNICTGTASVVPWGSADWLGFGALFAGGLVVFVLLGAVFTLMVSTFREGY